MDNIVAKMGQKMQIEPNDLLLFAHVVDDGSFTQAARHLGLPKSTVSRRLAALETQLGERLLLRTTRKLAVTDFGRSVLDHARHVAAEVEAAASLAQHRQTKPSGRLRVSMPSEFASLAGDLSQNSSRSTLPSRWKSISRRAASTIAENFDVALRMGGATTQLWRAPARGVLTQPVASRILRAAVCQPNRKR
jgi:DNA-binding transcriptional LysR family regulator